MSALRQAMDTIKDNIHITKTEERWVKPVSDHSHKQYVLGYEVFWEQSEDGNKPIPYIASDSFYIQFPSKADSIKVPAGTSRVTYNAEKKCVEYFTHGSDIAIRAVKNARHEPLPVPRYFSQLTKIEEVFELDMETGEITSEMQIDVLPEATYWKICLNEFERLQIQSGVAPATVEFRIKKYLRDLYSTRGITVDDLLEPIPQNLMDAIEFAEHKHNSGY
jgi:hypothetical protein